MAKKLTFTDQLGFYYNITKTRFSRLTGVSYTSLDRYILGTLKSEVAIKKINIAIDVIDELGLVWPTVRYIPKDEKRIKEYEKNKKKAEKFDKKFTKAYEKALKKAGI